MRSVGRSGSGKKYGSGRGEPDRGGDGEKPAACRCEAFLNDPITQYYGVGWEMLHLIKCGCRACGGQEPRRR